MSSLHVSIPEDTAATLERQAEELSLTPEQLASYLLRDVFGPSISDDLEREPGLRAALETSRRDYAEGRVVSYEDILDWHQSRPE